MNARARIRNGSASPPCFPWHGRRGRGWPRAGFTAIELILVITLMVVVAAVVLPGFPAFSRGQQLHATAGRLAAMIRYAGDWSVTHEQTLLLSYDGEGRGFRLEIEEAAAEELLARPVAAGEEGAEEESETPEIESAWRLLRLPGEITLESGELADGRSLDGSEPLRFLPDGRCDDALLVLAAGELRTSVRVEGRRGRVAVEMGDGRENETLD